MKAALGAFGLGVFARASTQVAALFVSVVAARALGPEQFGVYAIASVFVVIAQAVLWGGVYDFIVKGRGTDSDIDTPFWINLMVGAAGCVLIVAVAPLLSMAAHLPQVVPLMVALAPSMLVAAFVSWSEAVLLRRARLGTYYRLTIVSEAMACVVAVLCFRAGLGVWAYVVYRYVHLGFAVMLTGAITRRLPRLSYDRGVASLVLGFANRINASRIVSMAGAYAPDLLLGYFAGAAQTANYRFANRIVVGVSDMFFGPVVKQAWVSMAAHGQDAPARARVWAGLLQILSLVVWPALCGIATLSQGLVALLAGPEWQAAAPIIVLIAFARTLLVFEQFFEPLLGVGNRATLVFQVRALLAALSVLAFLVLARFGAFGAGIVQILIGLISAALSIRICLRETGLTFRCLARVMIPPALGAALAVAASLSASATVEGYPPSMRVAAAIGAAVLLWGLGLAVVARTTTLLNPLRAMS